MPFPTLKPVSGAPAAPGAPVPVARTLLPPPAAPAAPVAPPAPEPRSQHSLSSDDALEAAVREAAGAEPEAAAPPPIEAAPGPAFIPDESMTPDAAADLVETPGVGHGAAPPVSVDEAGFEEPLPEEPLPSAAQPPATDGPASEPLDADVAGLVEVTSAEEEALVAPAVEGTAGAPPAFEPVDVGEPPSTIEVPLEERARASVQAARSEESAPVLANVVAPPAAQSAPPTPPVGAAPAPSTSSVPDVDSLAGALPPPEPEDASVARSAAAEVPVPVDQVEQIARRVVGQMSEKVVREIAWDVIPDLAEALIKREIERLKKELQEP